MAFQRGGAECAEVAQRPGGNNYALLCAPPCALRASALKHCPARSQAEGHMKASRFVSVLLLSSCVLRAAAQTPAPAAAAQAPARQHSLMPVPASVSFAAGRLAVDRAFTVGARGHV